MSPGISPAPVFRRLATFGVEAVLPLPPDRLRVGLSYLNAGQIERFERGLRASFRPSPRKLMPSVTIASVSDGTATSQGR